jgi:hypothetical protein
VTSTATATLRLLLSTALLCTATSSLHAQGGADSAKLRPDTLSLDSLRARLARAEAAIALLRQQLAEESEGAVHARSRAHVELSAQVLTNVFASYGRVNVVDVPQTVLPPAGGATTPPRNEALGLSVRQTRVGAAAFVEGVLGGRFASDIDFDLFGGTSSGPGDRRLFPEPRLRVARARLVWTRTEIMFGSDAPLISSLDPVSLAAVGIPDFSGAGNLWNWLGQLRITRELGDPGSTARPLRVAIQAAVMAPYAANIAAGEPDAVDAGERSGRPAIEGRLRVRWGGRDEDQGATDPVIGSPGGEIGIGMHRGWVANAAGELLESHAVSVDLRAVLVRGVELRAEAYAGTLLRGLGGGGIAQNFGRPPAGAPAGALGAPVRDVAGWAQVNLQRSLVLTYGIGCGIDLADAKADPVRLQNTACAVHAEWRPAQPLVFGVEYRYLGTRYSSGTYLARHANIVFGVEL